MGNKSILIPLFSEMNSRLSYLSVFVLAITSTIGFAQTPLAIGSTMPLGDVGMEDVSERSLSLNDISEENGLMVLFISNTCPWVLHYEEIILEISNYAEQNDIGVVALNPNEGYRERGDNMEEMIKHADKIDYGFPYLLDENHQIADAFGARRTPEIYLFNSESTLVYRGAIDDKTIDPNGIQTSHLRLAIDSILSGESVATSTTPLVGCTIKRAS